VARKDEGRTLFDLLTKHAAENVDPHRIEAREGFVEHEHLRIVDEGGGELHALLIAERQLLYAIAGPVGDPKLLYPCVGLPAVASSSPLSRPR
jgi:hypothetical protein